ncbi:MAG: TetR/AcrR family transcriptional regulator [Spirochaeta sp.]|nr:TetR/AcrR family transcriptional regulator [Spirochaeta sp.]
MREQHNKHLILESALALFTDHGYDAVGVQALCQDSGITKPTLYHYFGSKQGVLQALVSTYTDIFLRELSEPLQYAGDLPQSLERISASLLSLTHRYPEALRLFLTVQHAPKSSESRRAAGEFFGKLRARLRELFAAAAMDHGNMRGREDAYAVSFLATLLGYIDLVLEGLIEESPDLAHRIMHQFSHGIYS